MGESGIIESLRDPEVAQHRLFVSSLPSRFSNGAFAPAASRRIDRCVSFPC
jgi:hypothetical protein